MLVPHPLHVRVVEPTLLRVDRGRARMFWTASMARRIRESEACHRICTRRRTSAKEIGGSNFGPRGFCLVRVARLGTWRGPWWFGGPQRDGGTIAKLVKRRRPRTACCRRLQRSGDWFKSICAIDSRL